MSQLDRQGLISQSNFLFPDNTTQEITPADIRQFNTDLADSLALTGSNVVSASYALTASYALFSEEAENAEHADAVQFPVIAKETLSKGDPVYVSGYNNGQGKPEVLKADASDSSKMPVVGLAMVDAVNNDQIFIISAGSFPNVDTDTGLTTPQVGQTLYVASGGGYTNVKPTGTNLIQNIGVIGRVQQNTGEILVSAIQRTNDLPNIQDGYLWVGDTNGVPQAVATSSIVTDVDTGSLATTGSNTFIGDQIISGSVDIKGQYGGSESSRIIINEDSGSITLWGRNEIGIWNTPVVLQGYGGDNGFEPSSLTGISTYGGDKISGSWGGVGNFLSFPGTSGDLGIYNANTGSGTPSYIVLGHSSGPSFISQNGGFTGIVGNPIQLQALGGGATSVQVTGDISGSTFTGSFVGDGTGLTLDLPSGLLSSSVTDFNTYSASVDTRLQTAEGEIDSLQAVTGSYATTGSNTFIGNQTTTGSLFVSGNLEIANTSGNNFDPIILGPNISIIPQQLNIERRLHVTQSLSSDLGAIVLRYPFTGSGGTEGELRQRFYQDGPATKYEQKLSGVDEGQFVAVNADLTFTNEGNGSVQFISPNGGINLQSLGSQTSNQIIRKSSDALGGNGQKDSIAIGPYTGSNGTVYVANSWGLQNYPGSGYNNAFVITKYDSSFQKVSEFQVGEGKVEMVLGVGTDTNYDRILLNDNGNGTSTAVIAADNIALQAPNGVESTNTTLGVTAPDKQGLFATDGASPRLEVRSQNQAGVDGVNVKVTGTAQITEALNLVPNDPLPTGTVGDLAVSGSNLFFYNGAWTQVV